MMKALAKDGNGKDILIIGLSLANLNKFRKELGSTFIRIDGAETNLPLDVVIFSGATEAHMAEMLYKGGLIGPNTKINIDDKLKS